MAYFIFLKYLRSLEEFRKNHHVKIPPKSPCANFQSLGKFKNPIFNSKILFLRFRPGQPYGPLDLWPNRPLSSRGPKPPLLAHLARASVASSRAKATLLVRVFRAGRFSLVSLSSRPGLSASSSSPVDRPLPLLLIASGHPTPPGLQPRDARRGLHSTP
jgi:hypothetical protein